MLEISLFLFTFGVFFMGNNNNIVPGFNDEKDDSIRINLEKLDDVHNGLIIYLNGYIDTYNSTFFERRIEKAVEAGFNNLVFNCASLNYISSTAIGSFTKFLKIVKSKNGDIVLLELQPKVYEVFQLLGFSQFFNIKDSLIDARDCLNGGYESFFPTDINCPNCSKEIRILHPSRFHCPECNSAISISCNAEIRPDEDSCNISGYYSEDYDEYDIKERIREDLKNNGVTDSDHFEKFVDACYQNFQEKYEDWYGDSEDDDENDENDEECDDTEDNVENAYESLSDNLLDILPKAYKYLTEEEIKAELKVVLKNKKIEDATINFLKYPFDDFNNDYLNYSNFLSKIELFNDAYKKGLTLYKNDEKAKSYASYCWFAGKICDFNEDFDEFINRENIWICSSNNLDEKAFTERKKYEHKQILEWYKNNTNIEVVYEGIFQVSFYKNDKCITFESNGTYFPKIFSCPVCSKRLKATKSGRFRCSECKSILAVDKKARVFLG